MSTDTLIILQKVGIKKTTFYSAIAKFHKLGLFDFQDKGFACRNLHGIKQLQIYVDSAIRLGRSSSSID